MLSRVGHCWSDSLAKALNMGIVNDFSVMRVFGGRYIRKFPWILPRHSYGTSQFCCRLSFNLSSLNCSVSLCASVAFLIQNWIFNPTSVSAIVKAPYVRSALADLQLQINLTIHAKTRTAFQRLRFTNSLSGSSVALTAVTNGSLVGFASTC